MMIIVISFPFRLEEKENDRKKISRDEATTIMKRKKRTFFNPPSFPTLLLPLFLYSSLSFSSSLWGSRVMPRQTSRPRTRHHKPSSSLLLSAENSKENFTPSARPCWVISEGTFNFSAEGYEERYVREGCSETKIWLSLLQSTLIPTKLWKNKMKMSWR